MIPVNDLQRHSLAVAADVGEALSRVAASGWFVLGREVSAFEREFAEYCGTAHCIGVGNGTDALELALRCVGATRGRKVVTVGNAGFYSTIAILSAGAEPLYADIDPLTMLVSTAALAEIDFTGVAAIVATHLYGRLAPVEEIVAIAQCHGIPVIEDCAQAHGARRAGKRAGAFGAIGCFSFYPTKNLGALGDGGAIVCNDASVAARLAQLRQYGWSKKYLATLAGGRNTRLDEMQAAVLRAKLPRLDAWNARRRAIGAQYLARLDNPAVAIERPVDESDVFHLFVVRARAREALAAHLRQKGVATDIHYPVPDPLQPVMKDARAGDLPHTRRACDEVLTLPCFPEMRDEEVAAAADAVNAWRP